MIDLATAILAINPSAKVIIYEEDINTIDWGETTPISNEDILAKQTELQTAYDNKEFVEAYTEKEILADTTKWDEYVVKYNKVRTDNPK